MRGENSVETDNFQQRRPRLTLMEQTTSAPAVKNDSSYQGRMFSGSRVSGSLCDIQLKTQGGRAPDMALREDLNTLSYFDKGWQGNEQEENMSESAEKHTWTMACHNRHKKRQVTLAVIGMPRSGKTTFIQHALDLKKKPSSKVATKRVSLEGVVSIVEMHELNMHEIAVNSAGTPYWPLNTPDDLTGKINGVLVIYSLEDVASIKAVRAFLRAISSSALPTVLVRSMCDLPLRLRQSDQMWKAFGDGVTPKIPTYQVSIKAPESHKRCVSFILRNIRLRTNGTAVPFSPTKRPKTLPDIKDLCSPPLRSSMDAKSKHRRAKSEDPCHTTEIDQNKRLMGYLHTKRASHDSGNEFVLRKMTSGNYKDTSAHTPPYPRVTEQCVESGSQDILFNTPTSFSVSGSQESMVLSESIDQGESFLQHTRCDKQTMMASDISDLNRESFKPQRDDNKTTGLCFDELVDRLLSQATSKIEINFAAIFLCFYRRFVPPSILLDAILSRFNSLRKTPNHPTARITSQLRHLNILTRWIAEFPGDFAHSLTRIKTMRFMSALADQRPFAMAVQEFNNQLDAVCEDDDAAWACSDVSCGKMRTVEEFGDSTLTLSASSAAQTPNVEGVWEEDPGQKACPVSKRGSASSSASSSNDKSSSHPTIACKPVPNAIKGAQRQARLLTPKPKINLCKTHWNLFMDTSDEDIARELTRIDWVLFSSIRPRDLIRHVSLREDDKGNFKNLQYVSSMINHFNHVAFWIANMVLLREKPKHRAKALEKCMAIAWKLRQSNNYNSLGAVIAGINVTAVHRLAQTRDLVPYHVQKDFMRLQILMGPQKSHFAYRLAWSNTPIERIPFLPLHCRDLATAEEGNPTYCDEGRKLINWKKFEIMGDVIINIQRSQAMPYHFTLQNEEARRLILECNFTKDDDELYNRSIRLEGLGIGETARKKFVWF